MGYLTPNEIPTTAFYCRRLKIPANLDILIAVNGALNELTKAHNWESFGDVTPDDIAAAMDDMFRLYLEGSACLIGSIQLFAVGTLPDGVLVCDGSSYLRVDYPELYSVLATPYITDADHFTVPDLYQGDDLKYGIVAQ